MSTVMRKDEVRRQLKARNKKARERFKQSMIRLFGNFYAEADRKQLSDRSWAE